MSPINAFLGGAIVMASLAIALVLLRFLKSTRDPFFGWFAATFVIEGLNRTHAALRGLGDNEPVFYLVRLLAYGCLIAAIWQKNRR